MVWGMDFFSTSSLIPNFPCIYYLHNSADSHDSSGDGESEHGKDDVGAEEGNSKSSEEEPMETDAVAMTTDKPSESEETKDGRDEYNPLVVRRLVASHSTTATE